jgi:hypothetical protein
MRGGGSGGAAGRRLHPLELAHHLRGSPVAVRGEGEQPRGRRPRQDDLDSDGGAPVLAAPGTSPSSPGGLLVCCRRLPAAGSCFDAAAAAMGPLRAPAEGSHQEFHGARPVFGGVHGWHNTAAALDQAWQHVPHLCVVVVCAKSEAGQREFCVCRLCVIVAMLPLSAVQNYKGLLGLALGLEVL